MRPALTGRLDDPVRLLTPRERDCLRHLENGATTGIAAAVLGISRSTFNAHLMSARRKLGVRSTMHALLMLAKVRATHPEAMNSVRPMPRGLNLRQTELADRLYRCGTFEDAWQALHNYAAPLGVVAVNFGVAADAVGGLDERGCSLWSSLPDELVGLYRAMGSIPADPAAQYVTIAKQPLIVDPEYGLGVTAEMPAPVVRMATALLDSRLNRMLCVPYRDPATGAAIALVFAFDLRRRREFEATVAALSDELIGTTAIFWDSLQRASLLADVPGLSGREREALILLSQGHSLAEAAERMRVSLRSVEKRLADIRSKLGTRTNVQSLYRAMVYRALG
jgi:DNA-binding CsgD family transcriptional regulator